MKRMVTVYDVFSLLIATLGWIVESAACMQVSVWEDSR